MSCIFYKSIRIKYGMLIKLGKILMDIKKGFFKKQSGFTLVELIIVLVILAILAAFTIPAMLGFVEDAKSKASVSLTREVYTAAQSAATEIYAKLGDVDITNNGDSVTSFKQKIGNKILELTKDDIGFTKVVDGEKVIAGNNDGQVKENFIEVAVQLNTSGSYNPSAFTYKNSAKVWFDRQKKDTGQFVVKAIWYVDKEGKYRIIIMEDASKPGGISTTVEKIK